MSAKQLFLPLTIPPAKPKPALRAPHPEICAACDQLLTAGSFNECFCSRTCAVTQAHRRFDRPTGTGRCLASACELPLPEGQMLFCSDECASQFATNVQRGVRQYVKSFKAQLARAEAQRKRRKARRAIPGE